MTFNPSEKLVIGMDGESFLIRCPFWANDLLESVPSKRWSKAKRGWRVGVVGQNVESVRGLSKLAGVEVTGEAEATLKDYETRLADLMSKVTFPAWYKFKRPPLPHQKIALDKFYGLRPGALHWPMQTGKSKECIDLCAAHRMEDHIKHVLVLTKRTLRANWIEALETDCPLPFLPCMPDTAHLDRYERFMKKSHDFKWLLVGWESLSQGKMPEIVMDFCERSQPFSVIGDESTFIASHKAARTEWAWKYARLAAYRYSLSGSPALEGPMKLFGQYMFIDPEILGIDDFFAFRNRYAIMGGYQHEIRPGKKIATEIVGYRNLDELLKRISPFTDSIDKAATLKLPPKRYEQRTVPMLPEVRKIYDKVKVDGVLSIAGNPDHVLENILGVTLRLRQIAGGYGVRPREERRMGKDGKPKVKIIYDPIELVTPAENPKMIEVAEFVEEIRGKSQFLLWAQFTPEIEGLRWHLQRMGLKIGELHGGVPDAERQPMVNRFREGHLDCVLGNAATGGMGYTMMTAEYNLFYGNSDKAIDRVQAEDRNWGQGTVKSPVVVDFATERSIDITVIKALKQKLDLSDFLKHRLGEITQLLDGDV